MGFFLIKFIIGSDYQINVLIHEFEDVSLFEAWCLVNDTFFEDEADHGDLMDLLIVASESDEPYKAGKEVAYQPSFSPNETIKIVDVAEISSDEYAAKTLEAQKKYTENGKDKGLYILSSLVAGKITLTAELEQSPIEASLLIESNAE